MGSTFFSSTAAVLREKEPRVGPKYALLGRKIHELSAKRH